MTTNTITPSTVTPSTVTPNTTTPSAVTTNTVTPSTVTSGARTSGTVTTNTVTPRPMARTAPARPSPGTSVWPATPLLSPTSTADRLGITATELLALVNSGRLAAYRFDQDIRFQPADVDRLQADRSL